MNPAETNAHERLIIALDVPSAQEALSLVEELSRDISFFKIGLELFTAAGPDVVRAVIATGAQVFLDLKLHDIPNTVGKAVTAAAALGVRMLTLHLSGGRHMLEAAAENHGKVLLLGVTVLTSSDEASLRETGVASSVEAQAVRLAKLGAAAGIGGLIASPHEVRALRSAVGPTMTIVTPGVRPSWAAANDQQRFTTPAEALGNGADYLVIGRPVTAHLDPREAVQKIIAELNNAQT
ncbi:MAG: orotidine-5'-phosphate decarboxylase [Verrucomicrobiota bacterium]|nr:orotidine-5'-phosphate decarboxylase [Verrucomicrobiota bacterium]